MADGTDPIMLTVDSHTYPALDVDTNPVDDQKTVKEEFQPSKWTERKFIMGGVAFVMLVVLLLLDANTSFVVPTSVSFPLTAIAMTWLGIEGYLDAQRIRKG